MRKREEEFGKVKKLYISMMSLFELADKLFGATYVAFMRSQKLSVVQISNLFSIQQILQAAFDYPTGTISDKIGRKRTAGYGFVVWGVGILVYAFAVNFWIFLPAMILMALGLALISGAPSAWLVDQMILHGVYEERSQILPKIDTCVRFFFSCSLSCIVCSDWSRRTNADFDSRQYLDFGGSACVVERRG